MLSKSRKGPIRKHQRHMKGEHLTGVTLGGSGLKGINRKITCKPGHQYNSHIKYVRFTECEL